jgi:CRP/FNR family transcriptional regulator, nitrogen oxide reductase regulator
MRQLPPSVRRSELFIGISRADIEQMICRARVREFAPSEVIHVADDPIGQVILLVQGLTKTCQSTERGQEVILRFCIPGEIISERTLVFERVHSSTALAVAPCEALAWESSDFNAMTDSFPDVRRNVERILKSRLTEFSQRLLEVSTKAASPRLAIGLVRLANRIGSCVGDHIEVRVSQETLAQMTGMGLSTVWRLLSIWRAQGTVKLRRETVEIYGLPQLLSCAGLTERGEPAPEPGAAEYSYQTAVVGTEAGSPVGAGVSPPEA